MNTDTETKDTIGDEKYIKDDSDCFTPLIENDNESWEDKIYEFYKVKNKFTQSSDLIHRIVTKIGRDVVIPLQNNYDKLKEDNALLLDNLRRLIDRMEENDLGQMNAVKRAKEAIQKTQSK